MEVYCQNPADHVFVDVDAEANAKVSCRAIRLQPQVRLRRFISTTASISSFVGPLGPGRRTRLGEDSSRYFCLINFVKMQRVEVFKTTAGRKTRAGRINKVHKPQ